MATKTVLRIVNNYSLREMVKPGQIVRVLGGMRIIKHQALNVIRAESSYSLQRLFLRKYILVILVLGNIGKLSNVYQGTRQGKCRNVDII